MAVVTKELHLESTGEDSVVDITEEVRQAVDQAGLKDGVATVFVPGSTAAVTTMEFEPGLVKDFPDMLARLAPKDLSYEHQKAWKDGNGHSHVKAALVGPSLAVPFSGGDLALGTWQQIVFVEFDVRPPCPQDRRPARGRVAPPVGFSMGAGRDFVELEQARPCL
jgi:secondary thiamine-phosphate synthase enzyme